MRRTLVAVLIALGLGLGALAAPPAGANPIYEPFCVYQQPPVGPGATVCTPD